MTGDEYDVDEFDPYGINDDNVFAVCTSYQGAHDALCNEYPELDLGLFQQTLSFRRWV